MATESRGCWDPGANAFVNEHFLAATCTGKDHSREDAQRGVKAQGLVRVPEKRLGIPVS